MLSRCTPIFVHSFLTSKISGTPSSLLCSWHLLTEEKKLLSNLHAFTVQYTIIMPKIKKTSITTQYTVYTILLYISKRIAKSSFFLDVCRKTMISYVIQHMKYWSFLFHRISLHRSLLLWYSYQWLYTQIFLTFPYSHSAEGRRVIKYTEA